MQYEEKWTTLILFGAGRAGMSVIEALVAYSIVTGGRLAISRKAMRFMGARVTIWERSEAAIA